MNNLILNKKSILKYSIESNPISQTVNMNIKASWNQFTQTFGHIIIDTTDNIDSVDFIEQKYNMMHENTNVKFLKKDTSFNIFIENASEIGNFDALLGCFLESFNFVNDNQLYVNIEITDFIYDLTYLNIKETYPELIRCLRKKRLEKFIKGI